MRATSAQEYTKLRQLQRAAVAETSLEAAPAGERESRATNPIASGVAAPTETEDPAEGNLDDQTPQTASEEPTWFGLPAPKKGAGRLFRFPDPSTGSTPS